jgi:SEC-C motif
VTQPATVSGDPEPTNLLYHYTAPTTGHLGGILELGQITTTESNLSSEVSNAGPPVVWLTDSGSPDDQRWAVGPELNATGTETGDPALLPSAIKTRAVLIVELAAEKVHHWPAWSKAHGIDSVIYEGLARTGGDPRSWWVAVEPISRRDVVGLVIAPYIHSGVPEPYREFFGEDLQELFESAEARLALNLIPATRVSAAEHADAPTAAEARGLGRNAPCWCGSGKKFKKCHGG